MNKNLLGVLFFGVLSIFAGCSDISNLDEIENGLSIDDNLVDNVENLTNLSSNDDIQYNGEFNLDYFEKVLEKDLSELKLLDNGCYEFEKYDEEYFECYIDYDCDLNNDCERFDELYEKFISKLDEIDFSDEFSDAGSYDGFNESFAFEDNVLTLTSYDILNGILSNKVHNLEVNLDRDLEFQKEENIHFDMFNEFTSLIPKKYFEKYLVQYKVVTDGEDKTLAYVSQLDNGSSEWYIALDIADYKLNNMTDFRYTLIHEFAHILTLNGDQVDYNIDFESCLNYFPGEGCLRDNSYFQKYYNKFWKGKSYESEEFVDFFKYENDFTTDYAPTNPGEDIAESFTHFVLNKKISNPKNVKEEKINFFYEFSELVSLREDIRVQLSKSQRLRVNN